MVICGYAGTGKSYLAHHFPNVIDLESTPFEKDWDRYFKCARHYSSQGFLVLLSCHKEIREKILELPYQERLTIFPCIKDKELYRKRYEERGNTDEFIKIQMENWDEWTSEKNGLDGEHIVYMESGETLYDTLTRLSEYGLKGFWPNNGTPINYWYQKYLKERLEKEVLLRRLNDLTKPKAESLG